MKTAAFRGLPVLFGLSFRGRPPFRNCVSHLKRTHLAQLIHHPATLVVLVGLAFGTHAAGLSPK
jgi:hypothetical protein